MKIDIINCEEGDGCVHLHLHKQTRRVFLCIDASLTCFVLLHVFLFSQDASHFFSLAVLTMAFLFNGYAVYSYAMIDRRHRDVVLNQRWLSRWTATRASICCFEWTIYLLYLVTIGSPVFLHHWALFFAGLVPIGAGYYELEKIEHNIGIHSLVVHVQKSSRDGIACCCCCCDGSISSSRQKQQIISVQAL